MLIGQIQAGMAHLNLVMIHPFRDGNGRMARCLQSLVLARGGILNPVFISIEGVPRAKHPAVLPSSSPGELRITSVSRALLAGFKSPRQLQVRGLPLVVAVGC